MLLFARLFTVLMPANYQHFLCPTKLYFSQNPVDVDIIKQLFHSILSDMVNSLLGITRLVGCELMCDSISWNNCEISIHHVSGVVYDNLLLFS